MVYGRSPRGQELTFEISGGLISGGLVFRDRETDSWWSLMRSEALSGELQGTTLDKLPVAVKTTWAKWRAKHPTTEVLSVNGVEHVENSYSDYFAGERGFRGITSTDKRLRDMESIYGIVHEDLTLAVTHARCAGGIVVELGGGQRAFLYRPDNAKLFESTQAWLLPKDGVPRLANGVWRLAGSEYSETTGFPGASALAGLDTFWYVWSLSHDLTEVVQ